MIQQRCSLFWRNRSYHKIAIYGGHIWQVHLEKIYQHRWYCVKKCVCWTHTFFDTISSLLWACSSVGLLLFKWSSEINVKLCLLSQMPYISFYKGTSFGPLPICAKLSPMQGYISTQPSTLMVNNVSNSTCGPWTTYMCISIDRCPSCVCWQIFLLTHLIWSSLNVLLHNVIWSISRFIPITVCSYQSARLLYNFWVSFCRRDPVQHWVTSSS